MFYLLVSMVFLPIAEGMCRNALWSSLSQPKTKQQLPSLDLAFGLLLMRVN